MKSVESGWLTMRSRADKGGRVGVGVGGEMTMEGRGVGTGASVGLLRMSSTSCSDEAGDEDDEDVSGVISDVPGRAGLKYPGLGSALDGSGSPRQ